MLPPTSKGPRKNSLGAGALSLSKYIQMVSKAMGMMAAKAAKTWTMAVVFEGPLIIVFMVVFL